MKTRQFLNWTLAAATALALTNTASAVQPLRSATIGSQSPVPAAPGAKAMFPVTVTRAGGGGLSVYLSIAGLPAGATTAFVPPEVTFTAKDPSTKKAVLVVTLDPFTEPGEYPLTVSARHGASPQVLTCSSLLTVGSVPVVLEPPVLNPPVVNPDGTITISGHGTPGYPVLVQANTNLLATDSWETIGVFMLDETGLFSIVQADAANFSARFFRAVQ